MPVFRRSSAAGEAEQAQDAPAQKTPSPQQAKKGRPTPKRSEAERNRYRSVQGGTTSGRAPSAPRDPGRKLTPAEKQQQKDRARAERNERLQGMQRGEERYLGPRDRGPARRLARDYVDSQRRPSEFYMYALLVLLVALLSHNTMLETYTGPLVFVVIAVIAIDGFFIRRSLMKLVKERLPNESTRGLTMYAVMRAMQIRSFRNPKPARKPGEKI
jgi:hypothetical protein